MTITMKMMLIVLSMITGECSSVTPIKSTLSPQKTSIESWKS